MMKYIKVQIHSEVATVSLNRPEVRNAFHPQMIEELTHSFRDLSGQDLIAVVLRGEGESFCAGADLDWMRSMIQYSLAENKDDSKKLYEMFESVMTCEVPVLARLHGHVMGGALGLTAAADMAFAEMGTQFCFSEVKLGLAPAVISPFVLRKMRPIEARELMLTGEVFSADKALLSGLINFSGTMTEVDQAIEKSVKLIGRAGRGAVRSTKRLLNFHEKATFSPTVMNEVTQLIAERRVSEEAQTRMKEFLNKATGAKK